MQMELDVRLRCRKETPHAEPTVVYAHPLRRAAGVPDGRLPGANAEGDPATAGRLAAALSRANHRRLRPAQSPGRAADARVAKRRLTAGPPANGVAGAALSRCAERVLARIVGRAATLTKRGRDR